MILGSLDCCIEVTQAQRQMMLNIQCFQIEKREIYIL
ncbi:unnamed protein product [Paramecium octaurelia]|uniref:Uncharacterized protein n=1 Tax=Paramecium octaurelia TaxID=43137 RepID=A0A8S1WLY1_PAROT|nr:unnamed protein product [Paramecium octaurelia]